MKYVRTSTLLLLVIGAFALTLTGADAATDSTSSLLIPSGTPRGMPNQEPLNTFTVSNTNGSGAGSLSQAITDANNSPGYDRITFSIGSGGNKTIAPNPGLPVISDPVYVDATTQPGCTVPCIELNGQNAQVAGLRVYTNDSTVKGFIINRFPYGIWVKGSNNVIRGNYIGVNRAGNVASANDIGIEIGEGTNNLIGGTSAADRNVISGNGGSGITIARNVSDVRIVGNYIGTDANGNSPITNIVGIYVDGASNVQIGGASANERNLISGNLRSDGKTGVGVWLANGAHDNVVQGNYIGTNAAGNASVPNLSAIHDAGANNVIGGPQGTTPGGACTGACNLLSGNAANGLVIQGGRRSLVQGNFFGLNKSGTGLVPNYTNGIWAPDSVGAIVGGSTPQERNVFAGNYINVEFYGTKSSGNTVIGNYFGVTSDGLGGLVGRPGPSVLVTGGTTDFTLGGSNPGEGNLISGGGGYGVQIFPNSNNIRVVGNFIGVAADGTPLGNAANGVETTSSNTTITYNVIANNGHEGIRVKSGNDNIVRFNSIYNNGRFAINLGEDGYTPNDPGDSDNGPNGFQNFPDLSSATYTGGVLTIKGNLNSKANGRYELDFYVNSACDVVNKISAGEGETYVGSTTVTTDGSGNASINVGFNADEATGVVTALATDSANNTSEFSHCVTISTKTKPTAPQLVSPGNGETLSINPPLLDWNPSDGATKYKVYIRQDSKSGKVVHKNLNVPTDLYTPLVLAGGHTYYWRIKACNSMGCGNSKWWSFIVP